MFIHFDETPATDGDAISSLQELDRIEARVHAVRAQLLDKVADPQPRVDEFRVLTPGSDEEKRLRIADVVRDEISCALRRSPAHVQAMIDMARLLAGPLSATREALDRGAIRMDHVQVIARAAHRLPGWWMSTPGEIAEFTAACEELQGRVLPVAARASMVNFRACARRAVLAIDAEGEARRREQAKTTRDIWITGDVDGMSLLMARMTTEQAMALKVQIDAAGFDRAYSLDAKAGLTMGEHRVEALAAMVLGGDGSAIGEAATQVRAHLSITIDPPTLLGLQEGSAELAGEGAVPVAIVARISVRSITPAPGPTAAKRTPPTSGRCAPDTTS